MAIAPLTVIGLVVNQHLTALNGTAEEELAASDLSHAVDAVYQRLESSHADVEHSLLLAHAIIQSQGGVRQTQTRRVVWQTRTRSTDPAARQTRHRTTRQKTHRTNSPRTRQVLPRLYVGKRALSPRSGPRHSIADQVSAISGTSCAVFQRINVRGDMLSVSSNAAGEPGPGVVGKVLPAYGAGGKANPAIQAILTKRRFVRNDGIPGRSFMTAYEPIERQDGNVIGMLYVGLPQQAEIDKVNRVLSSLKLGPHHAMFAIHGTGPERGQFLFSSQAAGSVVSELPNTPAAEAIVNTAALNPGHTVEQRFETEQRIRMVAKARYFAPANWVVGVAIPLKEYEAAAANVRQIRDTIRIVLACGFVVCLVVAGVIWFRFSSALTAPLVQFAKKLHDDARQGIHCALQAAAVPSERNTTFASQTSKIEQQVEDAQLSADQAKGALVSLADSDLHADQATVSLDAMKHSMAELNNASSKIGGIMKEIDQIALQSKILALNASIEAARAGGAGVSFAIVADEFGRLAERCKNAAQSTTGLVSDSIAVTAAGSDTLDKLTGAVSSMADNTNAVKKAAQQAQSAGELQASITRQVRSALTEMERSAEVALVHSLNGTRAQDQIKAQAAVLAHRSVELSTLVEGGNGTKSGDRADARTRRKQKRQVSAAKAPAGTRSALQEC